MIETPALVKSHQQLLHAMRQCCVTGCRILHVVKLSGKTSEVVDSFGARLTVTVASWSNKTRRRRLFADAAVSPPSCATFLWNDCAAELGLVNPRPSVRGA